jgi:hypothetical protein
MVGDQYESTLQRPTTGWGKKKRSRCSHLNFTLRRRRRSGRAVKDNYDDYDDVEEDLLMSPKRQGTPLAQLQEVATPGHKHDF